MQPFFKIFLNKIIKSLFTCNLSTFLKNIFLNACFLLLFKTTLYYVLLKNVIIWQKLKTTAGVKGLK